MRQEKARECFRFEGEGSGGYDVEGLMEAVGDVEDVMEAVGDFEALTEGAMEAVGDTRAVMEAVGDVNAAMEGVGDVEAGQTLRFFDLLCSWGCLRSFGVRTEDAGGSGGGGFSCAASGCGEISNAVFSVRPEVSSRSDRRLRSPTFCREKYAAVEAAGAKFFLVEFGGGVGDPIADPVGVMAKLFLPEEDFDRAGEHRKGMRMSAVELVAVLSRKIMRMSAAEFAGFLLRKMMRMSAVVFDVFMRKMDKIRRSSGTRFQRRVMRSCSTPTLVTRDVYPKADDMRAQTKSPNSEDERIVCEISFADLLRTEEAKGSPKLIS